jgi:DNA-binding NarL/FixJ family response regulator
MNRVRVLLAEDHTIVAEGLAMLLRSDFELVGTVADGRALIDHFRQLKPDVVVADVAMPGLSGLEALRQLKSEGHDVRFIFLTAHAEPEIATEAIRAGAAAYLLKLSAGEELITAIREVLQGRIYLSSLITREVLSSLTKARSEPPEPVTKLSSRQREVLQLIAQGLTMKQIAAELKLSRRTVETYKYEMMATLDLRTTAELIQYAVRLDLPSC